MLRSLPIAALILVTGGVLTACQRSQEWNGSLEEFLNSQGGILARVIADAEYHRLQIIYTRIDRDASGRPAFTTFRYRVNSNEYFYPASTVKLPTALLALERINALGIDGLSSHTPMLTGASESWQTEATSDTTAAGGLPSVAHYVRKILLVSDNDAYNRLYEFLGHDAINQALIEKGFPGTRIVHRLEASLDAAQNRQTNPLSFISNGKPLLELPARSGVHVYEAPGDIPLGKGEIITGDRVPGAKNFRTKNAFPLQAQHDLLKALLFPASVPTHQRFQLSAEDRDLVLTAMSTPPAASGIAAYSDRNAYPDGFVKFLMFGGSEKHIPERIRMFNKSGQAYGFLTDMAYVLDETSGVEFMLGATIYTNANAVFNDDLYEYEEIGFPFMAALGQAIYELELKQRENALVPE